MIALVASQCYDQNGETTTDTPCDSGSLPTFCCPSGYSCLSDGLCGKGNSLQMGSCSTQSWSAGSCVEYCRMSKFRRRVLQWTDFVKLPGRTALPYVKKATTAVGQTRAVALDKIPFIWETSRKSAPSPLQHSLCQQQRQRQYQVQRFLLQYR